MYCISIPNPRRIYKSGLLSISASVLLFAAFPAWCGPPFVTDDPGTLDYRQHELIISAEQIHTQIGKTVTPMIGYSYGVLADFQVGITVPYVFDSPAGQARQHGLGDLVLGAKYRFMQETDSRPMMTIAPLIGMPNGDSDKGLGNGGSQIFLPVWIQKKWGDWQGYGGGGYWINNAQDAGNHWQFGAVLQYDISEQVTVGAELFHETDQLPADTSSTGFNLGAIYNLDRHNRLLLSVGRGSAGAGAQNRFSSYLAYALTW
jgi:Putative MetA-pathway of phenol degradation